MPLANHPVSELHPVCDINHQYSNDEHGAPRSRTMLLLCLRTWRFKGVLHL